MKSMLQKPQLPVEAGSFDIEAFTLSRTQEKGIPEGLLTCESPVCNMRFDQTGIRRLEPRRFCSDRCRQDAWILRRAAGLLQGLSDERVLKILNGMR